ncbi:MAG: SpoIID/LytB domain-containing protein [Candidatus Omnitrophica bacterium]|nr:SpoIID/LytB domain-containing protein [Candidatus Omnitrophota bacterium]
MLKKAVVLLGSSLLFFISSCFSGNIRVDSGGIIKIMPVREYLYGVVGKEIDSNYPVEALKAQAVCARTNALYYKNIAREKGLPYDIKNSVFNQVYDKDDGDNVNVITAVDSTKGEILTYHGKIVEAFFCASSGGCTDSAENVWGQGDSYAISVPDPYSKKGTYDRWTKEFSSSELGAILGLASVKTLRILERDSSGRVQYIEAKTYSGITKTMSGNKFRLSFIYSNPGGIFIDARTLPSTKFKVKESDRRFIFYGSGYGHGVGMSQEGAKIMAEKGFDYKQILHYYFPLLKITRLK